MIRKEKQGGEEGCDQVHRPHLIKHLEQEVLQHKAHHFKFRAGIVNSDIPQAACCGPSHLYSLSETGS